MLYYTKLNTITSNSKMSNGEKLVLLLLNAHAGKKDYCWPSVAKLAEEVGKSVRTVQRILTTLERSGHIKRVAREGRSNQYWLGERRHSEDPPKTDIPPDTPCTGPMSRPTPGHVNRDTQNNTINSQDENTYTTIPSSHLPWTSDERVWIEETLTSLHCTFGHSDVTALLESARRQHVNGAIVSRWMEDIARHGTPPRTARYFLSFIDRAFPQWMWRNRTVVEALLDHFSRCS